MVPVQEYDSAVGTSIVSVPTPTCTSPAPPEMPRTVWLYDPPTGGPEVGSGSCRRKVGLLVPPAEPKLMSELLGSASLVRTFSTVAALAEALPMETVGMAMACPALSS